MNFFITSQGRTATKWLAWLMNNSPSWWVGHERTPRDPQLKWGLVSSSHKQHLVDGNFDEFRIGVIIRDPYQTCLSAANKMENLMPNELKGGRDKEWYRREWLKHMETCYTILDNVLEERAIAIDYEQFGDVDYVNRLLRKFEIDDFTALPEYLVLKMHTLPVVYKNLSEVHPSIQKVAEDNQWFYEKWKDIARVAI